MTREEARRRASELVAQMTVEERAGQLRYEAPAIERLGVPAYNWWGEGLHGVARAGTATVFPQAIGIAAAFDEELAGRIGKPLVGNYHGTSSEYITVAEGIRDYVDGKVRVLFSEGCGLFEDKTEALAFAGDRLAEAKIVAEHSDVVVLCLGLDETLEGEEGDTSNSYASGDKTDLLLPKPQRDLMEAVASVGKPVVLCLMTGSAMDLRYPAEHFNAVVQLWYPGARGGRNAAEILFGAVSPSGKLPVTFYEDSDRLPEFTDYRMAGRTYRYMEEKAQYPFGFGLTYGDVEVTEAELVGMEREAMSVKVTLQNRGQRDTDDVIQIYVRNTDSAYALKNPALCAFKRVHVKAGETVQTVLSIESKAFTVVTPAGERVMDGTHYELYAATFQPDERSEELMGRKAVKMDMAFLSVS